MRARGTAVGVEGHDRTIVHLALYCSCRKDCTKRRMEVAAEEEEEEAGACLSEMAEGRCRMVAIWPPTAVVGRE